MKIHRVVSKTFAEGPGCRFCIWVQGCKHHCKGCFATDTWDLHSGTEYTPQQVIEQLEKVLSDIDGITLLGGEPFLQADELSVVSEYARSRNKSVIAFSGYTYEELTGLCDSGVNRLLESTDLLIDGKYIEELQDFSRPLVGSENQRFIYLSDKISPEVMESYKNRFEIRISKDGAVTVNGMGDINKLNDSIRNNEFRRI